MFGIIPLGTRVFGLSNGSFTLFPYDARRFTLRKLRTRARWKPQFRPRHLYTPPLTPQQVLTFTWKTKPKWPKLRTRPRWRPQFRPKHVYNAAPPLAPVTAASAWGHGPWASGPWGAAGQTFSYTLRGYRKAWPKLRTRPRWRPQFRPKHVYTTPETPVQALNYLVSRKRRPRLRRPNWRFQYRVRAVILGVQTAYGWGMGPHGAGGWGAAGLAVTPTVFTATSINWPKNRTLMFKARKRWRPQFRPRARFLIGPSPINWSWGAGPWGGGVWGAAGQTFLRAAVISFTGAVKAPVARKLRRRKLLFHRRVLFSVSSGSPPPPPPPPVEPNFAWGATPWGAGPWGAAGLSPNPPTPQTAHYMWGGGPWASGPWGSVTQVATPAPPTAPVFVRPISHTSLLRNTQPELLQSRHSKPSLSARRSVSSSLQRTRVQKPTLQD